MKEVFSGTSLDFEIDLIDEITEEPIPGSSIVNQWVSIGNWIVPQNNIEVQESSIIVSLLPTDTQNLQGKLQVNVKVRNDDGKVMAVRIDEMINFVTTPLKDSL